MKPIFITGIKLVLMTAVVIGGFIYSGKSISLQAYQIKIGEQLEEAKSAFSTAASTHVPADSLLRKVSNLELWCLNNKIVGVIPQENTSIIAIQDRSVETLVKYAQGPVKGVEYVVETQASCDESTRMAVIQPKHLFEMKYSFTNLSKENTQSIYNFFVRQPGQLTPYSIKLLSDLIQVTKPVKSATPKAPQTVVQSSSAKAPSVKSEKNAVFENISAN